VIPAVHATEEDSAWKILSSGFAVLGAYDLGFYGKGIYLSTSAYYVRQYLIMKSRPAILVCFVVVGKCFPIIESHTDLHKSKAAKPITDGYHSHYVITSVKGMVSDTQADEIYDEIILGPELTALPLFVLLINKESVTEGFTDSKNNEESTTDEPHPYLI